MYWREDKYYFKSNPYALQVLYDEVISWMGTPYRHYCGVKGKGCDCIHLLARCLEKCGAAQGGVFIIPPYPKDWHLHDKSEEILIEGITKQVPCVEVNREHLQDGDIVLIKFGYRVSHCGIYFDQYIYQSLVEYGVDKRKMLPVCFKRVYRVILR